MGYIAAKNLPLLKEYRYSAVDKSLVSKYILKPFYTNFVIKCFPLWMAPNLITLVGLGFVLINFATLLYYNPTLDQECPPWVYLSFAIGLFLYQTFDAVDGSQARRTRQSGPLGELFDHGVDACNTFLETLVFAGVLNLGYSWKTFLILFGSALTFYVQTWEEYHTHTLALGVVSGPVEGLLSICVVYIITAFTGASVWHQSVLATLGIPHYSWIPSAIYNVPFIIVHIVHGGVVLFYNLSSSIYTATSSARARGKTTRSVLCGLLPAVEMWATIVGSLYLRPQLLEQQTITVILYAGLVNAYAVGRIITAHLTKSSFPHGDILLVPAYLSIFDSLAVHFGLLEGPVLHDHVALIFASLGLAIGVYGSFVHDVITSICEYLDIWCLTIKHPYNPSEEVKNK